MKPFDLEAAKRGDPIYETTMSALVHFVGIDSEGEYVVEHQHLMYRRTGNELRMAPKKRTVWVNLYSHSEAFHYSTQKEADADSREMNAANPRIGGKAWPLEIEE
jgi:hypothetical protein